VRNVAQSLHQLHESRHSGNVAALKCRCNVLEPHLLALHQTNAGFHKSSQHGLVSVHALGVLNQFDSLHVGLKTKQMK
jgi:hypothetical protein